MAHHRQGSIKSAVFWMFLISILLFWLPVLGSLLAGIVGGKKAGGVGAAIVAVFLPAIVIGGVLFVLAAVISSVPLIGAIAGMGGLILSLFNVGPLLLGAIIGGALA